MLKYRTGGWGNNLIEAVEVERETEHSVWVKGNRLAKNTEYHKYHNSWEDAHSFLISKARMAVDSARLKLKRADGALGNIKGLRKPV